VSHDLPRSPLAPPEDPTLPPIRGVRVAAAELAGRYRGRTDVALIQLAPGTAVAGVLTRSATRSASVLDIERKLGGDPSPGAAILVNAGNANAFTGRHGDGSVAALCEAAAAATGVPEARVFTASTGVIGERLPHERIARGLAGLAEAPGRDLMDAARAIMTTDTHPKGASAIVGGATIAGIAKGSGMIAPDMATMLAFVLTDAAVPQDRLQAMLPRLADRTFNRITVDGDTSTSDTLLVAATGLAPVDEHAFEAALEGVLRDLAHQVVRDGEGATRFVTVTVSGAADEADAHRAARSIAESPLVKTALAAGDPNWGRIVMAVGKSGARADRDRLAIRIGPVEVAREGWLSPLYREEEAAEHMRGQEVSLSVDLGIGTGEAVVWTCDLTTRYVSINADYRS
jgi:glutamate N-acetyltransferase/amino-acid N-acetyltransferase